MLGFNVEFAEVAASASHNMVRSSCGDIVWHGVADELVVGRVRLHIFCRPTAEGSSGFWSLVEAFRFQGNDCWAPTGELACVQLEFIKGTATWAPMADGCRVLLPPRLMYDKA